MDPALARQHGVLYVHLAALAIDLDRIADAVEHEAEEDWPFGWEVFLTEVVLLAEVDPEQEAFRNLVEDLCTSALDASGDEVPLGAQVLFAVHDAVTRGDWPRELGELFDSWQDDADASLAEELAPLWEDPEVAAADLAAACLKVELDPPIAPTTRVILEAIVEVESDAGEDESADDSIDD